MAAITFLTNVPALNAQRRLGESTRALSQAFERLSTGLRINRPGDDAAALSVAAGLDFDAHAYAQGVRNINDGISALNIADGAIDVLSNIVVRLQELATESVNGTYSNRQRGALDAEAQALAREFARITRTTSYNGIALFAGSTGSVGLQAGYSSLASNFGGAIGAGTFARTSTASGTTPQGIAVGDLNGDGNEDLVVGDGSGGNVRVFLGGGDGTFAAAVTYSVGANPSDVKISDFNGDGKLDIAAVSNNASTVSVLAGRGDGTFSGVTSSATGPNPTNVTVGDFNGDGSLDLATADVGGSCVSVLLNRGNGSFTNANYSLSSASTAEGITAADYNGDGITDLVAADFAAGTPGIDLFAGKGDGTFSPATHLNTGAGAFSVTSGDFNGDGVLDLAATDFSSNAVNVLLGLGHGSFAAAVSYAVGAGPQGISVADVNGDGAQDLVVADASGSAVTTLFGTADGRFTTGTAVGVGGFARSLVAGDFNNDGVQDISTADQAGGTMTVLIQKTNSGLPALLPFSIADRPSALSAMAALRAAGTRLAAQRAQLGAFQARSSLAVQNLASSTDLLASAKSTITDADVAQEAANGLRAHILQQEGAAVLAQADHLPQIALELLKEAL